MSYDFISIPDRSGCGSSKWDAAKGASTECVPLSVADMEFPTAPPIIRAIEQVANHDILGYTHATERYYDAVCGWMKCKHNFEIQKEWILMTPGVVDALAVLVDAVTKPEDEVIILTPVYYPFDMAVLAKSRHMLYSTLINNNGHYEIDFKDLEEKAKRPHATALLFCNPHNPIGRVWTKDELKRVADICCDNGVFIIDDEIHNDLIMPGYEHTVMATVSERVMDNIAVCTAPSKTFNIAGLQCSNIIIPNTISRTKALACSFLNMQSQLNIFAYAACIAAYTECEDWLKELIQVIAGNAAYITEFMAENFPEIQVIPLEGTYLLWLDMRALGMTHVELKQMLENAGLYLDNGEMFGPAGRGFQRINLACARTTLEKAMARFKHAVEEVRKNWAENGKPYHKTLQKGDLLEHFIYDSPRGGQIDLAKRIQKPTLLVFSRYFECEVCQQTLKVLKKAYPVFRALGCDVKVIMQSTVKTLSAAQKNYPFELIADPQAKFYDAYNIFEADSMVGMIAGDKMVEKMIGADIKGLLDSDLVKDMANALLSSGEKPKDGPRELQLSAFIAVDKQMRVTYAHYCRTMGDFPDTKSLLKGLKGS